MTDSRLLAQLKALPPSALLPVSWLLDQLAQDAAPAADLTPSEFGEHFKRSASTVRAWCEAGRIPGAFKLRGTSWRIPADAVEAFRRAQAAPATPEPPTPSGGDLDDWRRRRRPA